MKPITQTGFRPAVSSANELTFNSKGLGKLPDAIPGPFMQTGFRPGTGFDDDNELNAKGFEKVAENDPTYTSIHHSCFITGFQPADSEAAFGSQGFEKVEKATPNLFTRGGFQATRFHPVGEPTNEDIYNAKGFEEVVDATPDPFTAQTGFQPGSGFDSDDMYNAKVCRA
ncbi:hypothetical protein DL93DRAFT_2163804 [Clavulina sp. PMI_390]|nr:hypothetical protein DL93DRAFT_2163804 [Clavulina sp. PMI_390]